jgi:steroid delta-isomerase-like uncharacterized protein
MFNYKLVFVSIFVFFAFLISCTQPQTGPTAEEQANLAAMNRIYDEVVNQGKLEVFDELVSPDMVEHEKLPGFEPNREGVKQWFQMMHTAFPDLQFQVDDIFAAGDKVVARITMNGTQQGEFMGIKPTGKTIAVKAIDIVRFDNGKLVEHWGVTDAMSMMQQLGVIPAESEKM